MATIEPNKKSPLEKATNERMQKPEKTNEKLQPKIVQHNQMEKTLAHKENLLQMIINATHDAIISIGNDGLITLFNPAAEEMFGYKKEEMLGQPLESTTTQKRHAYR